MSKKMTPERRRKWIVNEPVQQGLIRRLAVYWAATWLGIFAVPICVRLLFSDLPFSLLATELVSDLWFPMMMSLLIMPILAWDSIRFTHRIAGPIHRVGNDMRRLARRETVAPIQLRNGDFCQELAHDFNQVAKLCSTDSQTADVATTKAATY